MKQTCTINSKEALFSISISVALHSLLQHSSLYKCVRRALKVRCQIY